MKKAHSFHIPVMGIGFTIDTPLKVAQYGIDSVISLVDDILLEKLRKMYSEKFELPYQEISEKIDDFRAKRITAYLDLIGDLAEKKFESLKDFTSKKGDDLVAYMHLLPDNSKLKTEFKKITSKKLSTSDLKTWVSNNLVMGAIDVNIMTKVDKENFKKGEKLPSTFNDAHAALRGFAQSKLNSSVVLSAGMNPRLYSYMGQFDDFYPDENGYIKKRIILKVSDYRSALIQGRFLAKKGLWVSEYRVESGLNCGGHAFATEGFLLGPVLEEFKTKRNELHETISNVLHQELLHQKKKLPKQPLTFEITAQGGVGTQEEHNFLLQHYNLDSVGWGSPFLLVPEATTVDKNTLNKLAKAEENDIYLSDISPLGVPFNNLRNNTKDLEKQNNIAKNRPGSSCPKKYVALNKEFKTEGICTASREYQYLKLKELNTQGLSHAEFTKAEEKITAKSCTCVGLGTSALLKYNLSTKVEGNGVSVCPGPNIANYSKVMSLQNITDHIYGRINMISKKNRPNFFIKELQIYLDFLITKFEDAKNSISEKEGKYFKSFAENMTSGIHYYKDLFKTSAPNFENIKDLVLKELEHGEMVLNQFQKNLEAVTVK